MGRGEDATQTWKKGELFANEVRGEQRSCALWSGLSKCSGQVEKDRQASTINQGAYHPALLPSDPTAHCPR